MPFHVPIPKPEHVEEFKGLYAQHFGAELSHGDALEKLIHLLAVAEFKLAGGSAKESRMPPPLAGERAQTVAELLQAMRLEVSAGGEHEPNGRR